MNHFKNYIHRCIIILVCVSFCFSVGCQPIKPTMNGEYIRPGLSQDWHTLFDESRQGIARGMTKDKIPGLSIAIVDREGLIWTAGFGYTDYDLKTPVTPDTIFSTQSITKALTATLAMCAVQDELIDLDTPITEYLPDFKVNSRFENDPQDKITLRHLLMHRAGLIHEAPVGNNFEPECPSFKAHIDSISDTWLKHKVNSQRAYSNLGMDLVAYILEAQTGKSFADYLKEKLFDPLDMHNSSADIVVIQSHSNRAIGHMPYARDLHLNGPMVGAGGVYSSARDFAKYIQFNLNRGKVNNHTLLRESVFDTMHQGEQTPIANKTVIQGLGIVFSNDGANKLDDDNSGLSGAFWGGGFGFLAFSAWSYEYEIGALVFTNMVNHNQNEEIAVDLIHELIHRKLVKKNETPGSPIWKIVSYDGNKQSTEKESGSQQLSRYQPHWRKYTGSYKYPFSWKPTLGGRILKIMGLWGPSNIRVYENEGYLEVDGKRLDEHLPGVFFTVDGDCLDFRGPTPLWKGYKMKKK